MVAFFSSWVSISRVMVSPGCAAGTAMALELGMSRTSLFSKLKTLLGQSPQAFLMGYRLNRAKELLKEGDLNVSEVAYRVGFSTLTGFSRSFKNKFGIPPSAV